MGKGEDNPFELCAQTGRNIIACICFLICVGPILIITGVVVLTSAAHNTRQADINDYNNVVADWINVHRPQFELAKLTIQSTSGQYIELAVDKSVDTLNDRDSTIHTYTPLKYTTDLSNVVGSQLFSPKIQTFYFKGSNGTDFQRGVNIMTQTILYENDLKCADKGDSVDCGAACRSRQGEWDSIFNRCTINQTIAGYCSKVTMTNGKLIPDNSYGGPGCMPGNNSLWAGEEYRATTIPGSRIDFSGPVIVRHANDPFIFAGHLTHGTYNFGMTTAQKVETGFALIIIGGVLLLPMIIVAYCVYKKKFAKKHKHKHDHEERVYIIAPPQPQPQPDYYHPQPPAPQPGYYQPPPPQQPAYYGTAGYPPQPQAQPNYKPY